MLVPEVHLSAVLSVQASPAVITFCKVGMSSGPYIFRTDGESVIVLIRSRLRVDTKSEPSLSLAENIASVAPDRMAVNIFPILLRQIRLKQTVLHNPGDSDPIVVFEQALDCAGTFA